MDYQSTGRAAELLHLCLCSPLGNMLARVSMMLGQSSVPALPPVPPKPWLDDKHRSINTHYFTEPGPLGLKVMPAANPEWYLRVQ